MPPLPWSASATPRDQSLSLTTLLTPTQEMGQGAARMLRQLMESAPQRGITALEYAPQLLYRPSTRPPAPAAHPALPKLRQEETSPAGEPASHGSRHS